jgi:hypothetical protein
MLVVAGFALLIEAVIFVEDWWTHREVCRAEATMMYRMEAALRSVAAQANASSTANVVSAESVERGDARINTYGVSPDPEAHYQRARRHFGQTYRQLARESESAAQTFRTKAARAAAWGARFERAAWRPWEPVPKAPTSWRDL